MGGQVTWMSMPIAPPCPSLQGWSSARMRIAGAFAPIVSHWEDGE